MGGSLRSAGLGVSVLPRIAVRGLAQKSFAKIVEPGVT